MDQWRRVRPWLLLALLVVLTVGMALWLSGALLPESARSPLPTPAGGTPARAAVISPQLRDAGIALQWVALGVLLALGVVFALNTVRRRRGR
jgi:hypothetical protein